MSSSNKLTLFTIGHSNHNIEDFLALLHKHGIEAIADVRSSPHSRYCPQFNVPELKAALMHAGIAYVFLGKELGARPDVPSCYVNGRISYEKLAARPEFTAGLERVRQGARKYRLALMCAEKDPITCHRMILLCRHLRAPEVSIEHILADGCSESNAAAELRLCAEMDLNPNQLSFFETASDIIEQAYERQARRIAFVPDEEIEE